MPYKDFTKKREFYYSSRCIDCNKVVYRTSKRCKSCENKKRWKIDKDKYWREKMVNGLKNSPNRFKTEITRDKIRFANKGKKNPFLSEWNKVHNPLIPKEKRGKIFRKLSKDKSFQEKRFKGLCKKPTLPEIEVIRIINENNLPFDYVGDGKIIIDNLNPDFIFQKKIIEVFGRFWHQTYKHVDYKRTEEGRKEILKKQGYDLLVLWDDEIKSNPQVIKEKIVEYLGT